MRVTIEGRISEVLPANFQPAPGIRNANHVALRPQRHPHSAAIAMSLPQRTGGGTRCAVWDAGTGELLWAPGDRVSDVCWSPNGEQAFALINSFERGPKGRGVGHRLQRYSWPDCQLLEELLFSVPSGGADYLSISPSGRLAAVVAIEQEEYYYEVLELVPKLRQLSIRHNVPEWLGDCPAFSPDDQLLVAVGSPGPLWWCADDEDFDEDYEEVDDDDADEDDDDEDDDESDDESEDVSAGGPHRLGAVYVHDLSKKKVKEHPLMIDLPRGWHPHDPESGSWEIVWGPEFAGRGRIRLWLPDGKPLLLKLPLTKNIKVTHRLNPAGRRL